MSKKTTKRALAMSFVSVFLCVCMLVGTTFAWFTDSVTSSNNIIKSGTLDVTMHYADGKEAPASASWNDASTGQIFNYDKWEPGYVDVKHIQIKNNGTLALKYQLSITPDGETSKLTDVIDVYYFDGGKQIANRAALDGVIPLNTLTNALIGMGNTASGNLKAGESHTVTIALKMRESADNQYQNLSIGSAFAVQLLATQLTYEKDSFDDLYDQNAGYAVEVKSAAALADALRGGGLVKLTGDIAVSESMTVPDGVTAVLDLNGNEITAAFAKGAGAVLTNNGTLTIKDGTIKNTVTNGDAAIRNKGTLTLDGAEIVGAPIADGGYPAYALDNYGKLTVEDGSSITSDRGAIYMNDGSDVAINGGNIAVTDTLGTRVLTAHVIYAEGSNSKLTINDGNFALNYAAAGNTGASVICPMGATIDVYGGNFSYAGTTGGQSGIFQNYMGNSASLVNIYGGTYNDTTFNGSYYHNPLLATGYEATDNGDGTWTVAMNQTGFENAISNAADGDTLTLGSGTYIIPDSAQGKTLTIVGNGNTVVATQDDGSYEGCDYSLDGATVTFEGVTINTDSTTYTGYARCKGTYNNCTINGTFTLYDNSTFNNCTFNVSGDVYNIWTWGAPEATFNNCTFNSDGKALLLYGTANTKLTLNDCTFNDKGGLTDLKAAIEIGNDYNKSYELIVNDTVVNGYEINDKGINTGTTLWANKNSMGTDKLNVVVDGVDVY